ncbi:hypothetical protein BSKO_10206 [Bryopsis sp. KO-2023]|nr:hypothetical protein BSKO_10206 [Bryopsis sp. KO-2023]
MELPPEKKIFQGAEAKVFEVAFLQRPTIVKQRFSKKYRIPELDKKLTLTRLRQEARCMLRARKLGVLTPVLYLVDCDGGCLYMEKISGKSVKQILSEETLNDEQLEKLWKDIGVSVARLHDGAIIHGDITTSNMMVRDGDGALVIIDFGLSSYSKLAEDKGVDLYVLERAITSAHPGLEEGFNQILEHYEKATRMWTSVNNKYREVRMRGRKRPMIG